MEKHDIDDLKKWVSSYLIPDPIGRTTTSDLNNRYGSDIDPNIWDDVMRHFGIEKSNTYNDRYLCIISPRPMYVPAVHDGTRYDIYAYPRLIVPTMGRMYKTEPHIAAVHTWIQDYLTPSDAAIHTFDLHREMTQYVKTEVMHMCTILSYYDVRKYRTWTHTTGWYMYYARITPTPQITPSIRPKSGGYLDMIYKSIPQRL